MKKEEETRKSLAFCASLSLLFTSGFSAALLYIVHESGRSNEGSRDVTKPSHSRPFCLFLMLQVAIRSRERTRLEFIPRLIADASYSVLKFQRERIKVRRGAWKQHSQYEREPSGGGLNNQLPNRLHAKHTTTNPFAGTLCWLDLLSPLYLKSERWAGRVSTGLRSPELVKLNRKEKDISVDITLEFVQRRISVTCLIILSQLDRYWWTSVIIVLLPLLILCFYLFR